MSPPGWLTWRIDLARIPERPHARVKRECRRLGGVWSVAVRDTEHDAIGEHDVVDVGTHVVIVKQKVKRHITKGADHRVMIAFEDGIRIGVFGIVDRVDFEGVRRVCHASIVRDIASQPNSVKRQSYCTATG